MFLGGGQFFKFFWMTYIALIGLLGLSMGMMAGRLWADAEFPAAAIATLLGLGCALLCGVADDARRALDPDR